MQGGIFSKITTLYPANAWHRYQKVDHENNLPYTPQTRGIGIRRLAMKIIYLIPRKWIPCWYLYHILKRCMVAYFHEWHFETNITRWKDARRHIFKNNIPMQISPHTREMDGKLFSYEIKINGWFWLCFLDIVSLHFQFVALNISDFISFLCIFIV
jgi:hypothetical protein